MDLRWESFVYAILAFGILYWLLNRYAFGPLFSIMEKRREMIQEQMNSAEKNRAEADQFIEEQKQALQQARKEAYDIIEQARITSSKQADDIVQTARNESTRIKDEALQEIESEKNRAVAALKAQVSGLSVLIASKIIEKQVDEQSQKELVDQYLQNVGNKS
ncbi:F0F1 ATP synthase subunit B [Cohnella terricola]|uniref:ATP synthase subunit b n=1 Tax=Cohnella terricola TaxID=1289167 RepID=A0A559JB59_9BACL|nr:F0F1 ATP synthase subunit B [Cohnella terricola]TVX97120.1 F0F1 ATP synthase subunit B [Cohnella terricola]